MYNKAYRIYSTNHKPAGYLAAKRIADIVISLICIIMLLPLLAIIAAAIRLDSKGPAFFNQVRSGLDSKPFVMYKFRSMIVEAECLLPELEGKNDVKGCMFKLKNDPRVTRVGRILRKTSFDELPQFFNVLKGEMSIVGPRPPIQREVVKYEAWHKLRLSVKPGITGLWQVSGRNTLGFGEMVRLDLKYIRERSFWYDFGIIVRTIPVFFGDKKAF